jgi:hypothetical protein
MNKLKMLAVTALAAVTIGTGALVAAPSASAQPQGCSEIAKLSRIKYNAWLLLRNAGYENTHTAQVIRVEVWIMDKALAKAGC